MEATVKGILQNFLYMVKIFGYVLTANRIYYEGRTQPPLLTQMMATYYTYTKDKAFIIDNIVVCIVIITLLTLKRNSNYLNIIVLTF